MSTLLGQITQGTTSINVYGEPGPVKQLVELKFATGERLGRVGIFGAATPRVWSVYVGRMWWDPRKLAESVERLLNGESA